MNKLSAFFSKRSTRITVGVICPLIAAASAIYIALGYPLPGCSFNYLTGMYCPGCGAGRALSAALHLNIKEAIGYNILFCILFPFIVWYLFKVWVKYVFGKDIIKFPDLPEYSGMVILVVIIVYWILRNIPFIPFVYLAP